MAHWNQLPTDIVRTILSSRDIPCATKVELQKDLGNLSNRLKVSPHLTAKLDRILRSRKAHTHTPGNKVFSIQSDDGKVDFTLLANSKHKQLYVFNYKTNIDIEVVSYDNFCDENKWVRHSSRYWIV